MLMKFLKFSWQLFYFCYIAALTAFYKVFIFSFSAKVFYFSTLFQKLIFCSVHLFFHYLRSSFLVAILLYSFSIVCQKKRTKRCQQTNKKITTPLKKKKKVMSNCACNKKRAFNNITN
jgi:hypothetical protein